MRGGRRAFLSWSPGWATAIYIAVSFVWIYTSDSALAWLVPDEPLRQAISIGKGFAYVSVTAILVYWLVRSTLRSTAATARAYQASEQQFRDLLDRVDLLAVIFGPDGRVAFCNAVVLETTGWSRDEVLGVDFFERFLGDPRARELWALSDRDGSGATAHRHLEAPLETSAGERRMVRWTATILHDGAGEPAGGTAVGEDVTARQQFETEMQQIQKMDALGRLAGSVAHDFNNLLTAISGYTDLVLAELGSDDRAVDDVREIRRAADRASAMTAQLLAFSRRRPIQAGRVDLATVVLGMEPMLRRLIGEQIELVVEVCNDSWVLADQGQLEQAVLNLALNARDAMPAGGILRVDVEPADPALVRDRERVGGGAGPHVLLSVSDTGTGIAPGAMPHLFEPFFTTKPKGKGTGLGLATVYSAVAAASGQVWAESESGHGTRFRILLPSSEPAAAVAAEPRSPAAARSHGGERVLVAEDDPAVRALVRTVLEREGYAVTQAAAGDEAIAASGSGDAFDLLVTDLVMPGIGGRELVAQLRAVRRSLPVLFISGYDEDPELLATGEHNLEAPLLRKPFSAAELVAAVRTLLDGVA